jgi:hypothetical protein
LATTFMGDLDEAAIRKGRSDQRIGIFPPDLLSRVGRLTAEMQKYSDRRPRIRLSRQRTIKAIKIINKSTGFGMATLGKPGWFTAPRPHTELKGAPFGFGRRKANRRRPTAETKKIDPVGADVWDEWKAIDNLDESGNKIKTAKDWDTYVSLISTLAKAAVN